MVWKWQRHRAKGLPTTGRSAAVKDLQSGRSGSGLNINDVALMMREWLRYGRACLPHDVTATSLRARFHSQKYAKKGPNSFFFSIPNVHTGGLHGACFCHKNGALAHILTSLLGFKIRIDSIYDLWSGRFTRFLISRTLPGLGEA